MHKYLNRMIQRIQSLYMLLSLLAALVSLNYDWVRYKVEAGSHGFFETDRAIVVYVLLGVSLLLTLMALFQYKRRRLQIPLIGYAILGLLACLLAFAAIHYMEIQKLKSAGELDLTYDYGTAFIPVAMILLWMAGRAVKKDEALVRSVDRLR